ncbi:MAG: hypothetical protein R3F65_23690 [bacterium]
MTTHPTIVTLTLPPAPMPRLLNALRENQTIKRNRIKFRRDGDVLHVAGPGIAGTVKRTPLETVVRLELTGFVACFRSMIESGIRSAFAKV